MWEGLSLTGERFLFRVDEMLTFTGKRHGRYCDALGRRDFLRVGGLTLGGLSLADLLRWRAAAGEPSALGKAAILLYLPGGPSHLETWDPKPLAPVEFRGPFGAIQTALSGVQFCELFPRHAQMADRFSIVRSCCHTNSGHGGGERWVLTGYDSASPEFELPHDYPTVGPVVAKMKGPNRRGVPALMNVPPSDRQKPAYLGHAYGGLHLYSNGRLSELSLDRVIPAQRLDDRRALRTALDRLRREADGMMDSLDLLEQEAFELVTGDVARKAFDVSHESDQTRDRYGSHEWGKCCLLARRLVEAGVTFVSVGVGSWDQHGDAGGTIHDVYPEYAPQVDQAVTTLLSDLYDRGLIDNVTVFLCGEFGRTPRINSGAGRDHWPQAMSVLMAGGGLQPGIVVGETNSRAEYPIERPVSPADVLATVYHTLGIDYRQEFTNSTGRPVTLLPDAEPIRELL